MSFRRKFSNKFKLLVLENLLNNGDVLVTYRKNSLLSWIISKLTSKYNFRASHIGIKLDNGIYESSFEGVKKTNINKFLKNYDLIYIMRLKEDVIINKEKFYNDLKNMIGTKYGFLQIIVDFIVLLFSSMFSINFRYFFDKDYDKNIVCSEYVAKALKKQNIYVIENVEPHFITPFDYIQSEKFTMVYEYEK